MKNGTLIAIVIGIAILFIGGMYAQKQYPIFSTVAMTGSCADVLAEKTNGAGEGECFINFQASHGTLAYVLSAQEKVSNRAVSPAYPDGTRTTCLIDYCTSCWENIYTCSGAKSSDGSTVQVCKKDSDCFSERCVNGYCKEGGPETCSSGNVYCISGKQFKKCLANGKYSGILQCPTGTSCQTNMGCVSPSTGTVNNTGTGTGTGTLAGYGGFPEIPMQYIWIGIGILAVIVVLSLVKKK
jgi:hypothetical protein